MERAYPFHTQNAPYSLKLSSLPFAGRLFINPDACPKPKQKTLVSEQRLWLNSRVGRDTLCVFTDGSKANKAAGWAITGIHAGLKIFTHKIPFAKKASSHDAEMMALSHASRLVCVRADLGGHLKYSRRWSGVRAGVLLGAQGAVRRGENRGEL